MSQEWVLLIHQLPPSPTNLRVRTWRNLQRIGAIAIKNSVYVLPFNDKTYEDFQWLKQEIESASGEATVLRASAVEGATDVEIVNQFSNVRDEEYSEIVAELEGLTGVIREPLRRLEVAGIEQAAPILVDPARTSDVRDSRHVWSGTHFVCPAQSGRARSASGWSTCP